jgi:broad specificity phosphatase PhoE
MIYFVRHGQTDWNFAHKIHGTVDIPLNKTGIAQAQELKKQFADITIDLCFSSPLGRAKQTAEIIYNGTIKTDCRLKERNYGEFERKEWEKIPYADLWDANNKTKWERAERVADIEKRVYEFWDDLKKYKNKNVLVVSHAGVAKITQGYFYGKPANGDYTIFKFPNCALVTFEYK